MKLRLLPIALLLAGASLSPGAGAQSSPDAVEQLRNSLVTLVRALVDQNVLSVAKAEEMLRQAGIDPAVLTAPAGAPPPPAAAAKPPVRVPYVPEVVKRELREEIRQEVLSQARAERWGDPGALPDWLSRLTIRGDLRLRFEHDGFAHDNAPAPILDAFYQADTPTKNTTVDRDRMRLRARLGAEARVDEDVRAGMRITTSSGGDANNPVSTNVDLGQSDRRFGTALDLAYIGWTRPTFTAQGGRVANPYQASDLIYATDLTFDGITATYRPRFNLEWSGFATGGVHPLREVESSATNFATDKWLYGAQAGVQWRGVGDSSMQFAAAYYNFSHLEGQLNPASTNTLFNDSAPLVRNRGNTMFNIAFLSNPPPTGAPVYGIASKFKLVNLNGRYQFARFDPVRLTLDVDFVKNVGFNRDEILNRIGPAVAALPHDITNQTGVDRERTKGYRFELQIGHPDVDRLGNWQFFAGYRYLERDAVPDGLTSADYRLGGTDQKAGFLGVNYGLARYTSATVRYVNAKSIDLAPKFDVDCWYLDLNARF